MFLTSAQMRAMLSDLTETGNSFDPAATFVRLYKTITEHGPDTVMADVTQTTGAIATGVAVTAWSDPIQLPDGKWARESPLIEFRVANSGEAQGSDGWMLATLATLGVLKSWKPFPDTVNLPDEFHPVQLVVRLVVDPDGNWDATVIVNPPGL